MANCLGHSAAHVSTFLLLVTPNNETPDAAQLTEAIAARLINFVDQTGAPEQLWLCLIPKARYNQTHWMYCLSIWAPGLDGPRIESTLMKLVVRSNLHHICSPPAHIIASWGAEAPRTIMKELSHRGHWAVPDPPTHVAATHTGPLFPIQSDPASHHSAPSLTTSPRWDALPVIQPTGFWEPAMIHLTLCFQAGTLAIARNSPADTLDVGHLTAGYTGNLLIPVHSCAPHSHEGKGGMGKAGKGGFGAPTATRAATTTPPLPLPSAQRRRHQEEHPLFRFSCPLTKIHLCSPTQSVKKFAAAKMSPCRNQARVAIAGGRRTAMPQRGYPLQRLQVAPSQQQRAPETMSRKNRRSTMTSRKWRRPSR